MCDFVTPMFFMVFCCYLVAALVKDPDGSGSADSPLLLLDAGLPAPFVLYTQYTTRLVLVDPLFVALMLRMLQKKEKVAIFISDYMSLPQRRCKT